jgi:hypothetical protein
VNREFLEIFQPSVSSVASCSNRMFGCGLPRCVPGTAILLLHAQSRGFFRAENAEKRRETPREKIGHPFYLCGLRLCAEHFVSGNGGNGAGECLAREWEEEFAILFP